MTLLSCPTMEECTQIISRRKKDQSTGQDKVYDSVESMMLSAEREIEHHEVQHADQDEHLDSLFEGLELTLF